MLITIIVACEIGFWLVIVGGLIARYPLGRARLGGALLVCAPIVDLVLLATTVVDLSRGATAEFAHGLSAAYLGFSVAFGHGLIRWADERFAHRFAGGPAPVKPPRYGGARTRYEWGEFRKAALAWGVSSTLLVTAIVAVGDGDRTAELQGWLVRLTIVLAVWSLWPISLSLRPARPKPRGKEVCPAPSSGRT